MFRSLFQHFGHTTSLLQLDANHGFTNPAQVHNNNSAFGYHPESAKKAWHQALALLTRKIGRTTDV
jgi:dienelactone hydrolase